MIKYDPNIDWDQLIFDKIKRNSSPDWCYCDIGSCTGVYTRLFKELSIEGVVYSFEANPFNYGDVLPLNSDNCIVENKAISDINGVETIYCIGTSQDHESTLIKNSDLNPIEVESITLDSYFKNRKIDLVKIDVEGSELKVISGGMKTIKKAKFVIIECHNDFDWGEIYDKLHTLEFKDLVTDLPIDRGNRSYQIYKIK